jgi:ADP-ribose pyrophosphatase YjhB (NUDIX family)
LQEPASGDVPEPVGDLYLEEHHFPTQKACRESKSMPGRVIRESGQQFAALPLMRQGKQVWVVSLTSRGTGRWVLPKGWAEQDLTEAEVAAKEALQEAGFVGELQPHAVGTYSYLKKMPQTQAVPGRVEVFAMWVDQQLTTGRSGRNASGDGSHYRRQRKRCGNTNCAFCLRA